MIWAKEKIGEKYDAGYRGIAKFKDRLIAVDRAGGIETLDLATGEKKDSFSIELKSKPKFIEIVSPQRVIVVCYDVADDAGAMYKPAATDVYCVDLSDKDVVWHRRMPEAFPGAYAVDDEGFWQMKKNSVVFLSAADGSSSTMEVPVGLLHCLPPVALKSSLFCLDKDGHLIQVIRKANDD